MKCPGFEIFSLYLDCCVDENTGNLFETHVDNCENCSKTLALAVTLDDALRKWWIARIAPPNKNRPAFLYYYLDKQEKKKYELARKVGGIWVGRDISNKLAILDDATISKRHLKIMFSKMRGGHFRVMDNSSFGSAVYRDKKLKTLPKGQWFSLMHGDRIFLVPKQARTVLLFHDPCREEERKSYEQELKPASKSFIYEFFNDKEDVSKTLDQRSREQHSQKSIAAAALKTMSGNPDDSNNEEKLAVDIYDHALLQQIFDLLNPTQQNIYVLHMGGRSYQEIALFFNREEPAIKKYIANVRYQLLQNLCKKLNCWQSR